MSLKTEILKGELNDEILALADSYEYKPYYFVSAAPPDGLNKIFRNRLVRFGMKCEKTGSSVVIVCRNESGDIQGFSCVEILEFDTAALGVKSGRILHFVLKSGKYDVTRPVADSLMQESMRWLETKDVIFTNIRTAALELPAIHAAEKAGFYLVDNGFTALYHKDNAPSYEKGTYDIRLFAEKDLPVVLDILKGAYETDRFHMDPKIPHEAAEELYRVWVHHFCMNPKEQEWVLIAERKGSIKGFFQYEYDREFSEACGFGLFSYGPAAVVRDRTALGAYYTLLSFAINDSIMRGGTYAMTRIPFAIQPILKLTLKLGPSFMSNDLTFHHWK